MADLTGTTLGHYRLDALIGQGGMATVYRAHQTSMDRDVAIKVMAPELAKNQEFVARFEREARVIAKLQHPHILPVIDFGRDGEHIFLVMRYVQGSILSERLLKTALTMPEIERLLAQIASALEYAHRQGVVHRDLKPTNVLLDEQDNTYLTDFGIAKMLAGTTSEINLTATGHVMGTPAYMAPEQWRSEAVDARTDVYALGIMLYEMLLGSLPFHAETPYGMMYKHFDSPPPLPRVVNPDLPERIESIILRALEKEPARRFPSTEEMAKDFSAALRSTPQNLLATPLPRATAEQIAKATAITQQRLAAGQPLTPPPGSQEVTQATDFSPSAPAMTPLSVPRPATPPGTSLPPGQVADPSRVMTLPDTQRKQGGRGLLVWGALLLAIVAAAVIGILMLNGDDGDNHANATQTMQMQIVLGHTQTAEAPTGTPTGSGLNVIGPEGDTDTPEADTEPSATAVLMVMTDTPEPTDTRAPTATDTPTVTEIPTDIPTATETPDLDATANALLAQRLTQTAESWTDTPTPDLEATVQAQLIVAMTQTAAAWTDTPVPTLTSTLPPPPTSTPRPSYTPSPTSTPRPTYTPRPTNTPRSSCTMRTRLDRNEGARTTLFPDDPTSVRSGPGVNNRRLRSITPGQVFWVIEGPECADNINWWLIEGIDQNGPWSGWIGEGQNNTYWIEPFDTVPVGCPGAPVPRLVASQGGRVTLSPPLPSRVRSSPERADDNVIGQMQPGETFKVVTGPVCDEVNRWRWWLVENRKIEGWVAEGMIGEYWLEPWTYP